MTPPIPTIIRAENEITVTINGTRYQVPTTFSETTLADYLRTHVLLTGTKVMCREGGCGACTVMAAFPDPSGAAGQIIQKSINACLCPILSCDGWEITTVEGIGNQDEPHPIQNALAEHYGTQCGYCTSGMVMRMYSLMQNNTNGSLTKQMVEDSFGGNICRCTGYRPILDAFKTFATDSKQCDGVGDVEDAGSAICKATGKKCSGKCHTNSSEFVRPLPNSVGDNAPKWFKPASLEELYKLMVTYKDKNPYYVVGHTGVGVYNDEPYGAYFDVKGIQELYAVNSTDKLLTVGANIPLTDLIDLLIRESIKPGFEHLNPVANNIARTAHPSVRNAGSWGGNLAMKNRHKDFPSDSFISFIISNARIFTGPDNIGHSLEDFVQNVDLVKDSKFIIRAEFPALGKEYFVQAYKIMPRNSNAHALVNSGMRAKISKGTSGQYLIVEKPVLVFGNITETFIHASATEKYLNGKDIGDVKVLQQALSILNAEIQPTEIEGEASPAYKKSLSLSLFYKFALEIVGTSADARYRSAVGYLQRPISSGKQAYTTKKELWPLTQPIPKVETMVQCTGEAKYISDTEQEGMLYAAFVVSTEGNATVYNVNKSKAMALPGVVRVFTAEDIPGANDLNQPGLPVEEFLVDKQIRYAGQPIAFVVAVTKDLAEHAAKLVEITYSNRRDVIITCEDAIKQKSFFKKPEDLLFGDADKAIKSAPNKVSGEIDIGAQAHFYMETQVCVSFPTEDGVDIQAGTQHIDGTQSATAQVLGISKNRINVTVRRNGGGFGGKGTRNFYLSAATGMAARILKKPVKMHMSLWDNMKMMGKRFAYYAKYQAGYDNDGKVTGISLDVYRNSGAFSGKYTEMPADAINEFIENAYHIPAWKISNSNCRTNTPGHTWCRGPGSTEAIYFIETIMEQIAYLTKKPSIEVKMLNFAKDGDDMLDGTKLDGCLIEPTTNSLLKSSSYADRVAQVDQFNQNNRWRKRGLTVLPMRWPVKWNVFSYSCTVSIYHNGGSVAVAHAGIELGQGINTKIAQVVAFELGIGLDKVINLPPTSMSSANSFPTAASITSELVSLAAMDCCAQLRARMAPVKAAKPNATWEETVEECYHKAIDLSARGWAAPRNEARPAQYSTYGATCIEVELDILTGEYQINRLDCLYDCGESMSPIIDIGQVEGGIIMGLGYFTSEEIIYEKKTGQILTVGTWKYKPPTAKDIPVDFRVELLPNAPNPNGILRSKCVGEPPLCMASSVVFALRNAIVAGRKEKKQDDAWFRMDAPITVERAQQYCATDVSQLRYSD